VVSPANSQLGTFLKKVWVGLCTGVFFAATLAPQANAGLLFSHPRDGSFKFTLAKNDPWFYYNRGEYAIQSPDKWQHFMGNYIFYRPTEKIIGRWRAIALFTSLDVIKEIGDGYREGASVRDLTVDFLGMAAALTGQKLICVYDDNSVILKYHFSFSLP
jgi:hypothetical protein